MKTEIEEVTIQEPDSILEESDIKEELDDEVFAEDIKEEQEQESEEEDEKYDCKSCSKKFSDAKTFSE